MTKVYLFHVAHLGAYLLLGILFGTGLVAGFGIDKSDETKAFPLFRLFVSGEHDFFDGAKLFEMRFHFLLGSVQGHATYEDFTDLLLLRDLFRVDLFAFDWREERKKKKRMKERKLKERQFN